MAEQSPQNSTGQQPVKKMHPVKKFFRRVLLFLLIAAALFFVGYYLYVTHPVKESASIDGTLVQFTVGDGFFFKTNEGVLNKGTSLTITTWAFSVREDSVANKIKNLVGRKVTLQYKETVGNFFWQGKTNRFVSSVEEVK